MDIHDKMVEELFNNKSMKALIYLIDHGRELEFEYNNKTCFISKDNSKSTVSIWVEEDEQFFCNMEELIEKTQIDNNSFKEIWEEIELGILY